MRFSVCNELFEDLTIQKQCEILRSYGIEGMEIAPSMVIGDDGLISKSKLAEIKVAFSANDISYAGLHWLLSAPAGYSLVSADKMVRGKTVERLKYLCDISDELGGGELTLGCPKQRSAMPPLTVEEALKYFEEGIFETARHLEKGSASVLCIEPLTKAQTNVINSFAEARRIVEKVNSPCVSSMLDLHNTADETENITTLIFSNRDIIKHFHVNGMDGGCPHSDKLSFDAKKALVEIGYEGWVSLEVFSSGWKSALDAYSKYLREVFGK